MATTAFSAIMRCDMSRVWVFRGILLLVLLLLPVSSLVAATEAVLLDAGFEDADLSGWRKAGDVCVAPAFCAGEPSGRYWVAFSTNSLDKDSFSMCGESSVGGLQSILRSPDLPVPFAPSRIRVDFDVKFMTNENVATDLGVDNLDIRLLTQAGPVVIASLDDSGVSPPSKNLKIHGDTHFHESACSSNWRYETGMLHVSYYRTFRDPVRARMAEGPMAIEFALSNQFDPDYDSAVVVDEVQVRIYR